MKKNIPPSMEQWKRLYDVALNIKELKPWDYLWDTELITLMLPGKKEPTYISVMGRNGECYGIGVYPGYESLQGLYRLMESGDEAMQAMFYQNCLMCYLGDREELSPDEREIIQSLGIKFRGKNNWIYFRAIKEGYYPWMINAGQAETLTEALENAFMAFRALAEKKIKVDFDEGETLLRQYSKEQKLWLNMAVPSLPFKKPHYEIKFTDEMLPRRLKNKSKQNMAFEMDILYIPEPIQNKPNETPYFPRLFLVADHATGELIYQNILTKSKKNADAVVEWLIQYIGDNKKPRKLFVRDKYFLDYIQSLCEQIDLPVVADEEMPYLNDIAQQMAQMTLDEPET